jgi:hypothetical protein
MHIRFILPLLATLAVLAGCSHSVPPSTSGDSGTAATPSFSQFTDIPVPDGARMDAERTLLLGQGDAWVGRLVLSVRWTSGPEMFDFYKTQMPAFKWQEISSVRSDISVMTWQRGDRIATIQIEETTLGLGTEVILTMGPVNGSGPPAAAGQPPQPNSAPAPVVTEQPLK